MNLNGAQAGHLVVISVAVLVGAAFIFAGVGDSSPGAHSAVLALLVGVVLILGIRLQGAGKAGALAAYPWLPGGAL